MNQLAELCKAMIAYDKGDPRRIHHFLKVHAFAALIGRLENIPQETQDLLEAAAILHDIGIHAAEEKHHSTAGKYQELEGPAIARDLLEGFEACNADFIDRVCFLIAHHHTYNVVDSVDYQILLEADFLVNAYEDQLSPQAILSFREKVFRTKSGIALLNATYAL